MNINCTLYLFIYLTGENIHLCTDSINTWIFKFYHFAFVTYYDTFHFLGVSFQIIIDFKKAGQKKTGTNYQ